MPAPMPAVVTRLRAAGCVFAEEEARLLAEAAHSPADLVTLVDRRVAGVPLEQVLGWAAFSGGRVIVAGGVFVPRRRSELLVEAVVALLGAEAGHGDPVVVADVCCGSGAIGRAVVHALAPRPVQLHAVDIDAAAVACAATNLAVVGGVAVQGDLVAALPAALRGRVDVVVASPPYVPTDAIALLPAEARDHEPRHALDGGPDGLDVVRRLLEQVRAWLAPGGWLVLEMAAAQADAASVAAAALGWSAYVVRPADADATVLVATAGPETLAPRGAEGLQPGAGVG